MIDSTMFYGFVKIFITYTTLEDTTGISPKYFYDCFCSQKGLSLLTQNPTRLHRSKRRIKIKARGFITVLI